MSVCLLWLLFLVQSQRTSVLLELTSLEGAAQVLSAVPLTLTDRPLRPSGGVHCALAPHTQLIRAALLILSAGLRGKRHHPFILLPI